MRNVPQAGLFLERGHVPLQSYRFKQGTPIFMHDFTDDLRHKLQGVWRDVEGVNLWGTSNKLATCQALFAFPFDHHVRTPVQLPRHLHLILPQHVEQNASRPGLASSL